jgi:hypothetical protein
MNYMTGLGLRQMGYGIQLYGTVQNTCLIQIFLELIN